MSAEHRPRSKPVCSCGVAAEDHRPSHNPKAWPICECGAKAANHRVKHRFVGDSDICETCLLGPEKHIGAGPCHKHQYRHPFVGVDGEGVGRTPHRYVIMAASTPDGRKWHLQNPEGLSSFECLKWLANSLHGCRVFSYGFGYDITHIVKDLPDAMVYDLLRPSRRYVNGKLRPVKWRGFTLDWIQGKFTVTLGKLRVVIWDLVKFFQQAFVSTLQDWDIPTEGIETMKAARSVFRTEDMPEMLAYCLTECRQLATLAERLLQAHTNAGLTLKSYFGPGSTASVLLGKMGVKEYMKDPPSEMRIPIACSFFGGWFENQDEGPIAPVYAADVSSAYPYQAYHLPCLVHGKWRHTTEKSDLIDCTTALIRYTYRGSPSDAWAPFPHRTAKGEITHPYRSQGWVWLPEYQAARGMGRLTFHEAWVYRTTCDCRPFAELGEIYRERVAIGKTGKGRVLKLGPNAVYGKLAQSMGLNPPYQNWIWAALITSGTRAQLLTAMRTTDLKNIIAVATDGIFSRVPLTLPTPKDTGTFDLAKPLGGWEHTAYPNGMLFIKPGIYFSLGEESVTVKARGIGRKALAAERQQIIDAWNAGKREWTITVDRFFGAKSCITPRGRRPQYGQWGKMPIHIAFECINRGPGLSLLSRDTMSAPYDPSLITGEDLQIRLFEDIAFDQP